MARKQISPIVKEKIEFIDENSYILVNILNNKIGSSMSVLETVTGIIISDRPLNECYNIDELKKEIDINKGLFFPSGKDNVDSYGIIFNVANYVNMNELDEEYKSCIREKLRVYISRFKNSGNFSKGYQKFVILEHPKDRLLLKKIDF